MHGGRACQLPHSTAPQQPRLAAARSSGSSAGCLRPERRQRCTCGAAKRRDSKAPIIRDDFEVPQVGWMWDSGEAAATQRSLRAASIKAKKSLGQNFCTDDAILADIVAAARVSAGDVVVEVGPGTGNLTRHLLATRARVLAVEKDDTLVERLRSEFEQAPNLQLVHGDVMRLDLQALVADLAAVAARTAAQAAEAGSAPAPPAGSEEAAAAGASQQLGGGSESSSSSPSSSSASSESGSSGSRARRRVKVVANLPYNITKDFLLAMLPRGELVSELSIMIQEEVAQRLVDPTPARSNYRAMSVITHYYSKPVYRFCIPKEKYFPVPGVDGALVTFKLLPPGKRLAVPGERGFISLIKQGFRERRKMLRNTLQPLYSSQQVEAGLTAAGVRPDARAQDLSVQQFAELYSQLQGGVLAQLAS